MSMYSTDRFLFHQEESNTSVRQFIAIHTHPIQLNELDPIDIVQRGKQKKYEFHTNVHGQIK